MNKTLNKLNHNIRGQSIELLQAALAEAVDLAAQTKQAHWNVKGPAFIVLHELFDTLHTEMSGHADTIAERLVALGGQAKGTVQVATHSSRLPEYPVDLVRENDHVAALSNAFARFGEIFPFTH